MAKKKLTLEDFEKQGEVQIQEWTKIITYCFENVGQFDIMDQINVISSMSNFANALKPIYLKNACKDDKETFLMKL